MGAWGFDHLENDTALDFIDNLINYKLIRKLSRKKKLDRSVDYDEIRAACVALIRLSKLEFLHPEMEIIIGLTDHLDVMLNDECWLDSWDDPQKVKQSIKSLIKQMNKLEGC